MLHNVMPFEISSPISTTGFCMCVFMPRLLHSGLLNNPSAPKGPLGRLRPRTTRPFLPFSSLLFFPLFSLLFYSFAHFHSFLFTFLHSFTSLFLHFLFFLLFLILQLLKPLILFFNLFFLSFFHGLFFLFLCGISRETSKMVRRGGVYLVHLTYQILVLLPLCSVSFICVV